MMLSPLPALSSSPISSKKINLYNYQVSFGCVLNVDSFLAEMCLIMI